MKSILLKKILCLGITLLVSGHLTAQIMDDAGLFDDDKPVEVKDLFPKSTKEADFKFVMPKGTDSFGIDVTMNNPGALTWELEIEGETKTKTLKTYPAGQTLKHEAAKGTMAEPNEKFSNHMIVFDSNSFHFEYYLFPKFISCYPDQVYKNIAKWDTEIPNALVKTLHIDFRPVDGGLGMYIDGVYAKHFPGGSKLKSIKITGGAGPTLAKAEAYNDTISTPDYQLVNFSYIANPGVMKKAQVSIKPGQTKIEEIPMIVLDGANSSDIELVKAMRGWSLLWESDPYMARTAWERYPTSQQSAVPNGYYDELYLLFALDPDPAKDRYLTFRMGRFLKNDGRVSGWAYTDLVLPKDNSKFPSNIKKVGNVTFKGKEVPLYFAKLPINCGTLLDFITNDPYSGYGMDYLDFEFLGRRRGAGSGGSNAHRPHDSYPSAFNLFGMTFHKAGIHLNMIQSEPGNIFYNDEVPETTAVVTCVRPGKYTLKWTILDTWGKKVLKEGSEPITFEKVGEQKKCQIDLAEPDIGHYNLKLELFEGERLSYTHDAAFALLGEDTRQATPAESPFGAWWSPYHCGISDPNVWMKLFHKVGIRRATNLGLYVTPEGVLKHKDLIDKYKLTINEIPWNLVFSSDPEKNPEGFDKFMHDSYDRLIKAFPDMKYMLVFHEGYKQVPIPELTTGEKVVPQDFEKDRAKVSLAIVKWIRKNHPGMKLLYGNSGCSLSNAAALLRNDFHMELIDFIGMETLAQGYLPERLVEDTVQSSYFVKELGKVYGKDLKVSGCYEFSGRSDRLFPIIQEQAAFYMRDGLLGLCHGFETLGLTGMNNAGDAYPQTVWGSGGLCRKAPLLYPKPMICAYSAMTRALDRIKFHPTTCETGNLALYVPEFERKDGKIAYAFWVPKGEVKVDFEFPKEIEAEYIESFGKTSKLTGKTLHLTASIYPQYLVVPCKADNVRHIETISPKPPESYKPEITFDSLDKIIKLDAAAALDLCPGNFEVKEVEDEQMGKCLEIRLIPEGNVPDHVGEYCRIELKNPITLNGTPDEIGYWVKGDGGWGQITFDIQDAKFNRFRNFAVWADFEGNTFFNFKGWYFMTSPMYGKRIRAHHTRSLTEPWVGEARWGEMVYPVTVTAFHVILHRKVLSPTTMKPAPAVIRIKEMGGIHNPQYQQSPELQTGVLPE